jgi:hypothetical protein
MFEHTAIPAECLNKEIYKRGQLGYEIDTPGEDIANSLKTYRLALIGLEEAAAAAIRKTLYQYARPEALPRIIDLGNFTGTRNGHLLDTLGHLTQLNIIPILLGGDEKFYRDMVAAMMHESTPLHWASVDKMQRTIPLLETLPVAKNRIQWHWMGVQKHLFQPMAGTQMNSDHLHYRLGVVRHDIKEMEPVIRDCSALEIHLCSVRSSEAPAHKEAGPSGFYSEEICQLSRYAGLSDQIRMFRVTGLDASLDNNGYSATCAAQSIWYFIEAIAQRKADHPSSSDRMTSYTVSFKDPDLEIIFVKSQRSGRWWMSLPDKEDGHSVYLSCSHKDYLMACQNILPDRYLNATMTEHVHSL